MMYNNYINFNDNFVAVKLPLIITQPPKKLYIKLDDTISFSIEARQIPDLIYEWRKVEGNLPPSYRCRGTHTKKLTISKMKEEDAGQYYCHVRSPVDYVDSQKVKLAMSE